jgi:glycosyltransferase involved in cell wall biosynthesis
VPPADPKALAEGIVAVLKGPSRDTPAAQGLEVFLSRFDIRTVAREYEEILMA